MIKYDQLMALCRGRRSHRRFSSAPVPRAMVDKILAVAATAPYASGRRDWEILVVDDPAMVAQMAAAVRQRTGETSKLVRDDFREGFTGYAKFFTIFESAPLVLVPVYRYSPALSLMTEASDPALARLERDSIIKSISCVAMLVLLAAESLDLGACYLTGPLIAEDELARLIAVKPGRDIGAVIPIGFPAINDNDNGANR